jgi:hypothetical protein
MFKFILGCLAGSRKSKESSDTDIRIWTEAEADRVRTFEETTISDSLGIVITRELATSRQVDFLKLLGESAGGLSKDEATLFITRVLRPISYALGKTFKNVIELEKADLKILEVAIAHWQYLPQLPRYGPHSKWDLLIDPDRGLTKDERIAVTDLAYRTLPNETFCRLISNGVSAHKKQLDGSGRG